jgi:hypothetical protein
VHWLLGETFPRAGMPIVSRAMEKATDHNKHAAPENWLEWLDALAQTFPGAETWSQPYSYFFLTRYPHLQPHDQNDDVGKRTYEERLRKQEELLSSNSKSRQALRKLSPGLRREVSALVSDLTMELEQHVKWKQMPMQMVKGTASQGRILRSLESKIRKLETTLGQMVNLTSKLPWPEIDGDVRKISKQVALFRAAMRPLAPRRQANAVRNSDYFQMAAKDTPIFAMVRLFWLFHYGCKLTVGDAEVRVAAIRNALWSEYAEPVECAIRKSDESKGCDAVRKAVERFRLPKGTPR